MWDKGQVPGGVLLCLSVLILPLAVSCAPATPGPDCEREPAQNVLFSSANFPGSYSKDTNCLYRMKAGRGRRVHLTFYVLDIESNSRCSYDKMEVYEGDGTMRHKYCGKNLNNIDVVSRTEELYFNFTSDRVQQGRGFLASWREGDGEREGNTASDQYQVTYPTAFIEGSPETICLELFGGNRQGASFNVKVFAEKNNPAQNNENWRFDQNNALHQIRENLPRNVKDRCFQLTLPRSEGVVKGLLELEIKSQDGVLDIKTFREITIYQQEIYPLIQTDKGHYKAKDQVKFRVLLLNHNLAPSEALKTIDEIWVEDPRNRRIAQWKDVWLDRGLVQREISLSEEPLLGQYKIVASGSSLKEEATFTVSEYVLPKFEVVLRPPAAVVRDAQQTIFKVCAKYTHGGSAKGSFEANFHSRYVQTSWPQPPPFVRNIKVTDREISRHDGCGLISLSNEKLMELTEKIGTFDLKVIFTEEGTGTQEEVSWKGSPVDEPFKLDVSGSPSFTIGGLPYRGEISVVHHGGAPINNELINVCVSLYREISEVRLLFHRKNIWSMDERDFVEAGKKMVALGISEKCHSVRTTGDGKIKFYVPLERGLVPADVRKLSIRATAVNYPANSDTKMKQPAKKLDVAVRNTDSPLTLSLEDKPKTALTCGTKLKPKIYFSSVGDLEFDLDFIAFSNGQIVDSGTRRVVAGNQLESYQDQNRMELAASEETDSVRVNPNYIFYEELELDIDYRVSPSLKLVVSVKDKKLEDSHTYVIEPCQQHKVTLGWSTPKKNPGAKVNLRVSSDPGSLCGVSATDKSVELLGNQNKISRETIGRLQAQIGDRKTSRSENYWEYQRNCPETYNALKVYQGTGVKIATDLRVVAECETLIDAVNLTSSTYMHSPIDYAEMGPRYSESDYAYDTDDELRSVMGTTSIREKSTANFTPTKPTVQLRTFFPENWLFDILDSEDGIIDRRLTVPHTLTTWVGEAFCLNSDSGLGVSEPASLLVSQDFFSELRLPFSVKRGEIFPLNISVFNYLSTELPITVSLRVNTEELEAQESQVEVCVPASSNEVVSIEASALALGDLNITVETKITNKIRGCRPARGGDGFKDTLRRPIRVKPEGVPVEILESEFKCLEEGGEERFDLKPLSLPDSLVPGSVRAWLTVTGDVMAPALDNVGHLVRLPTGCGEQNMAGLVPNIYLLQYLRAVGREMEEVERKAVEYMMVGYNRQQKYRHPGGSYSIWGGSDHTKGSTWLTAFVVKAFSDAAEFIDVDSELVNESVKWLLQYQDREGCFQKRGYVHDSYIKGGGTDDSLTAFVLTALLHADQSKLELEIPEGKLRSAHSCMMERLDQSDLYTSILAAHADSLFSLKFPGSNTEELVSSLTELANTTAGGKFWQLQKAEEAECSQCWWRYRPSSEAVEMTAYMVMSHVLRSELGLAVDSVKWLGRQRNSQGGFVSTQDTVVALQALSLYSQRVSRMEQNLVIEVENKRSARINEKLFSAELTEENSLLLRQERISSDLPVNLGVRGRGSGCALVQTVLRYNSPLVEANKGFSLTARRSTNTNRLEVCAAYTGTRDKTGMVVVEVELLTGWKALSPDRLTNEVEAVVQRVDQEEEDNTVILYFDEMTRQETCVTIEVEQVTIIKNSKEATVTVYDYYNRDEMATILYNM